MPKPFQIQPFAKTFLKKTPAQQWYIERGFATKDSIVQFSRMPFYIQDMLFSTEFNTIYVFTTH